MAGPPCGIFPESTRERREFKIAFYLVPYFFNVLSFFRGGGRERGVDLNQGNVGTEKEKETLVLSDGFAVAPGGGGELAVDDWRIPFEVCMLRGLVFYGLGWVRWESWEECRWVLGKFSPFPFSNLGIAASEDLCFRWFFLFLDRFEYVGSIED